MPALAPTRSSTRLDAAVYQAAEDAVGVEEAGAEPPAGFWLLDGDAARLAARHRDGGRWVLVTCRRCSDPARAEHTRERSLTAAQRFALSLWSDGLDAVWISDGLPDADAFHAAGLRIGDAAPVGLVWVSGGE